jgi:hypothetical protein
MMLTVRKPHRLVLLLTLLAAGCSQPDVTPTGLAQGETSTQCGTERWAIKTLTDPEAGQVNLAPKPTTVEELAGLPVPGGFGRNAERLAPELQAYTVEATLVEFKEEADSDIHLVLLGKSGQSMIAEIPDPRCAQGSHVLPQISRARSQFVDRFGQPRRTSWVYVDAPIRVTGVLFFDVHHGQMGVSRNGVELHPVIATGR